MGSKLGADLLVCDTPLFWASLSQTKDGDEEVCGSVTITALTRPDRSTNGQDKVRRLSWKYLHRAGVRRARSGWLLQRARRTLGRTISVDGELELPIMHVKGAEIVTREVVLEVRQVQHGKKLSVDTARVLVTGDSCQLARLGSECDAGTEREKHLRNLNRSEPETYRRLHRAAGQDHANHLEVSKSALLSVSGIKI